MTNSQKCHLPSVSLSMPTGGLRKPVVDGREDGEQESADQHVVEVRDDEVRVAELPVEGHDGQHDSGETGDQELEEEADAEQHRRREADLAAPHRAEPVEDLDAGRNADDDIVEMAKKVLPAGVMPTVNMWCAHTLRLMKPIATVAATMTG